MSGELLQELRRGADKAEIYSLAFNSNSSMLACTSDKGTVHVFKLRERVHDSPAVLAGGIDGGSAGAISTAADASAGADAGASASIPL
ncbi:hypothetical protein EON67_06980, partial [archaeon]